MKQEEFYVWLVNYGSYSGFSLPEFNPEFLKNYEISKLLLDNFGIDSLNKNQQYLLNTEAFSNWLAYSKNIKLKYDIPEILEFLPERIGGDLSLFNSEIQSLPQLKSVGESLYLQKSETQSLPELEFVGGYLYFYKCKIEPLPKLKSVGGDLSLWDSQIQTLPELESVGGI